MPRRNEEDVTFYWSEKQKHALLIRLAAYNKNNRRQPEAADWEQWATDLSPLFSSPIPPGRVKEAKERLKKKFNVALALRTNTGLGWDPVQNCPTCTDEYWEDFCKTHKWAKRARRDPLKNYDLYYEAFASTRARGAFESRQDDTDEEDDTSQPNIEETENVVGETSQAAENEEGFVRTMRSALHSSGRSLNIASSSRPISKRQSRSGVRMMDPEAKILLKSIANTLESRQSSKGTSSGATQPGATQPGETPTSTFDRCCEVISEMLLDDEQVVSFCEYLNWNPNCQILFLRLKETQRLLYVLKTLKALSNQQAPPTGPTYNMPQGTPFMGSQPFQTQYQQQFPRNHPAFPQQPTNLTQPSPNYQQAPHAFQQVPPNLQRPPQYYMGNQYPNFPGQFGGEGNDDHV